MLKKILILGLYCASVLNAREIGTEKQSRPREILTRQGVNNLQTEISQNKIDAQKADLIIISENNPQYLRNMIESVIKYAPDIEKIYVLKDPCYGKYRDLYESIKAEHNQVEFIKVGPSNFKSMLESIVQLAHNKHVLLSKSNVIFTEPVNLNKCIELTNQKSAPLFYLNTQEVKPEKAENLNPQDLHEQNSASNCTGSENQKITGETGFAPVTDNLDIIGHEIANEATEESPIEQESVFLWQFKNSCNKNTYMALYKKSDLLERLTAANYTCLQELLEVLG
jgi:hypothetical protein